MCAGILQTLRSPKTSLKTSFSLECHPFPFFSMWSTFYNFKGEIFHSTKFKKYQRIRSKKSVDMSRTGTLYSFW